MSPTAAFVVGMVVGLVIAGLCGWYYGAREFLARRLRNPTGPPPVERLDLKAGDRLVLYTTAKVSREQAEHMRAVWREKFPDLGELLVLDSNMRLGVLGRRQEPPPGRELRGLSP